MCLVVQPENLLIAKSGYLKLIDMGFAKKVRLPIANHNQRARGVCGHRSLFACSVRHA